MEPVLVRFARTYGWRAYAIPVLIVITIWVIVDIVRADNQHSSIGDANSSLISLHGHSGTIDRGLGPDPAKNTVAIRDGEGELPPGGAYTAKGTGLYHLASRAGDTVGQGTEKTFTYTIEIEEGLNPADYGGDDGFSALVTATLADPRGWTHDPRFAFKQISATDGTEPDLRIQLTSPNTTHEPCGNTLGSETSCFTPVGNRVIINEARWVRGALPFNGDIGSYRRYLINHEVGHGIGFARHEGCGGNGALAPVMMQQTLSLNNETLRKLSPADGYPDNSDTCHYNPWPYPLATAVTTPTPGAGPVPVPPAPAPTAGAPRP